jgi:SAM-dependent methyltransferase
MTLRELYRPTQDEAARQAFVGAFKSYVNGPLETQLAELYESALLPEFMAREGRAPKSREEAVPLFEAEPLYQLWSSLVYTSQDLLWETSGETVDRLKPEIEAATAALIQNPGKKGSLHLDPAMMLPEPIADTEIHRQPGGYFYQSYDGDMTAPALYMGAVETYRAAKGLGDSNPGEPAMGRYIAGLVKNYAPDLKPARVLDFGCGNGTQTVAYAQAWPKAEMHAFDLSAPFVRFGHAWAEDQGLAIHYHQMNAARTGFPDEHFDLIVSHIVCHETWHDILDDLLAEMRRLLRPGGLLLNLDIPYQPHMLPMPKQVTNHWQVVHNGEPFWTRFADTDIRAALAKAGFADGDIIADYQPMGAGRMYAFGGWKRA